MLAKNKKAYFDYHILEKIEAGVQLYGHEVKSVRQGKISLAGSYISVKDGEVFLINCDIAPYQPRNIPFDYNTKRDRKLLLHKKEIAKLATKAEEKGVTVIPLRVYDTRGLIKLEIGIAKGKKKWDKRETIKRRDTERKMRQEMKKSGP